MTEIPNLAQPTDPNLNQLKIEQLDQQTLAAIQQYSLIPQQAFPPERLSTTKEKERIADRLSGFNPKDNMVWHEITQRFGSTIKQPELLSIATVLAQNANIKLDRDAKRRKSVLVKWFEENWTIIKPYLDYVVLEDSHAQH